MTALPRTPTLLVFKDEEAGMRGAPSESGASDRTQRDRLTWSRVSLALRGARLEYLFLVIALAWGVAQVFIVPPLQVNDEGDHWFRAWALTDGQFTADSQGMLTLPSAFARTADLYMRLMAAPQAGSRLPMTLEGQAGFSTYGSLFNARPPRVP